MKITNAIEYRLNELGITAEQVNQYLKLPGFLESESSRKDNALTYGFQPVLEGLLRCNFTNHKGVWGIEDFNHKEETKIYVLSHSVLMQAVVAHRIVPPAMYRGTIKVSPSKYFVWESVLCKSDSLERPDEQLATNANVLETVRKIADCVEDTPNEHVFNAHFQAAAVACLCRLEGVDAPHPRLGVQPWLSEEGQQIEYRLPAEHVMPPELKTFAPEGYFWFSFRVYPLISALMPSGQILPTPIFKGDSFSGIGTIDYPKCKELGFDFLDDDTISNDAWNSKVRDCLTYLHKHQTGYWADYDSE